MCQDIAALPTVDEIARRHGLPVHRVEYLIRSRGIRPAGLAGNARVFSEADARRIGHEALLIDEARDRGTL